MLKKKFFCTTITISLVFGTIFTPNHTFFLRTPKVLAETTDDAFTINKEGVLTSYQGTASELQIPDTVRSIAANAFANQNNLTTITMQGSLNKIETNAFSNCQNLKEFKCDGYISNIETLAFSNCPNLTTLEFDSVGEIADNMIAGNQNNITIYSHLNTSLSTYAKNNNMAYTVVVDNSKKMSIQEALDSGEKNILLKGDFPVLGYLWLPKTSDVTVTATDATFIGQLCILSGHNKNFTWNGGTFVGDGQKRISFSLLRLENATFKNLTFSNAVPFGKHVFDLLGCKGVKILNCTFIGYGTSTKCSDPHSRYAEAIQLDHATVDASGYSTHQDYSYIMQQFLTYFGYSDTQNMNAGIKEIFNGQTTKQVTIKDCLFTCYTDSAGNLISYAQSPVGQHTYSKKDQNCNISFVNNEVINPIPLKESTDSYNGALHFVSIKGLTIKNNIFRSTVSRETWIQLLNRQNSTNATGSSNQLPSSNIKISNNKFYGKQPSRCFIELASCVPKDAHYKFSKVRITNNKYMATKKVKLKPFIKTTGGATQFSFTSKSGNGLRKY